MADIYKPTNDKNLPQDCIVERAYLELTTRVATMKIFNVRNKKIDYRIWKDWNDKRDMKHIIQLMVKYNCVSLW